MSTRRIADEDLVPLVKLIFEVIDTVEWLFGETRFKITIALAFTFSVWASIALGVIWAFGTLK
jgi:hypothetical protein